MAKVFISHRTADSVEAERLAREIKAGGHNVWLDLWEIGVGDSIVAKMNEGLDDAGYLVLCYSSADVMASWMSREWMSALARQLNGHGIELRPVRLTGGSPPAILADVKYADLVANWERGVAALLRAIK